MSRQFLEQQTICISAVPGALGHYLGAVINHVANPASALPNWANNMSIDSWHSQQIWSMFESLAASTDLASLQSVIEKGSLTTEASTTQVICSRVLDPAALSQLFPNSKCIHISVTEQDSTQIGYNALYHECYPKKDYSSIAVPLANAAAFINTSGDWQDVNTLLEDPMHRDNILIKCTVMNAGAASVQKFTSQNSAASHLVPYKKLFPYWKADRPEAAQELVSLLEWLNIETNTNVISQLWQQMLPKVNQIAAYK